MTPPATADPCGPDKKFSLFAPIRSINLRTEIPGPKSRAIFARRTVASGKSPRQQLPFVVANAHGVRVIDVDSNIFIDFAARAMIAGHTPQRVVEAVQAQAELLLHRGDIRGDTTALIENEVRLSELLNAITPAIQGVKKTILIANETDALQLAIRAAQVFTGRSTMINLADQLSLETLGDAANVAAILVDPIGANGNLLAPQVMQRIAQQCRENGWLLILDERQTSLGRTGKLFATEHYDLHDVQPDLLVIGHTLTGGIPLGAVTGWADVIDAVSGDNFGGDPLALAAAISTIELIRDQNFPRRAMQISEIVHEQVAEWQQDLPQLGDLCGIGGLLALKLENPALVASVIAEALQNGLLLDTRHADSYIRLSYPLMIPEEQLYEGLDVLEAALRTILSP